MYSISQEYTILIEEIIKKNFNSNFSISAVKSFSELTNRISTQMGDIFKESLVEAIEAMDEKYFTSIERKNDYYSKAYAKRTLVTIFGEITFKRHSFVKKNGGKSFFYIDKILRLSKYDKYDPLIKAWLMEEKTSTTFQKSADIVSRKINDMYGSKIYISRQQVFAIFKKLNLEKLKDDILTLHKTINIKDEETLYIMLDEKYIHLQRDIKGKIGKGSLMVKHAVLYTGIEKIGKNRNKLVNKHVFSSIDTNISFVEELQTFIDNAFPNGSIKNVIISGDGARWIKTFSNDITVLESKFKVFILDRFHLGQAIMKITDNKILLNLLRGYIEGNDKVGFLKIATACIKRKPDREEIIKTNIQYILNQWNAIQKQKHPLYLGCCMEGQISHNLAKFFSRVPKGYAFCNVEKHILFTNAMLNKIDVVSLILNQYNLINDHESATGLFSSSFGSNVPGIYNSVSGTTIMLKNIAHPNSKTTY